MQKQTFMLTSSELEEAFPGPVRPRTDVIVLLCHAFRVHGSCPAFFVGPSNLFL